MKNCEQQFLTYDYILTHYIKFYFKIKILKILKDAKMLANVRRNKIHELLMEDGTASVSDLSRIFKVSEVTIRQDLPKLEK